MVSELVYLRCEDVDDMRVRSNNPREEPNESSSAEQRAI